MSDVTPPCFRIFHDMKETMQKWSLPLGAASFGSDVLVMATTSGDQDQAAVFYIGTRISLSSMRSRPVVLGNETPKTQDRWIG